MDTQHWSRWAEILRSLHFTSPMLTLLEDGGAVRSLIAQIMLAASPLIGTTSTSWQAFAEMLEDCKATRAFAEHLRGEEV